MWPNLCVMERPCWRRFVRCSRTKVTAVSLNNNNNKGDVDVILQEDRKPFLKETEFCPKYYLIFFRWGSSRFAAKRQSRNSFWLLTGSDMKRKWWRKLIRPPSGPLFNNQHRERHLVYRERSYWVLCFLFWFAFAYSSSNNWKHVHSKRGESPAFHIGYYACVLHGHSQEFRELYNYSKCPPFKRAHLSRVYLLICYWLLHSTF